MNPTVAELTRKLHEAEQRFINIVGKSTDAILVVDPEGNVLFANPAAGQIFDCPDPDLVGKPFGYPLPSSGQTREIEINTALGKPRHAEMSAVATGWDGKPAYLLNLRDITERKKLEERYRLMDAAVNSANDSIAITTAVFEMPGPEIIFVNPAYTRLTGYKPEEVLGKTAVQIGEPPVSQPILDGLKEMVENRSYFSGERIFRKKDGQELNIAWTIGSIFNENGNLTHILDIQRNITEQKQAQEALKKSEARFKALVLNSNDLLVIVDPDSVIRYTSPSIKYVLGYNPEEVEGKSFFVFLHPDDYPVASEALKNLLDPLSVKSKREYRFRNSAGDWQYLELLGRNLLDDPNINGLVLNARNITDRMKAEQEILKSEELYRLLADNVTDIIIRTSPQGIIEYISPSCRTILGYTQEEMTGRCAYDYFQPDNPEQLKASPEFFQRRDNRLTILSRVRHKEGHEIWLEATARTILDPVTGKHLRTVSVGRDITERKQMEATLKASEERFSAAFHMAPMPLALSRYTNTTLLDVNASFLELTGFRKEEITGQVCWKKMKIETSSIEAFYDRFKEKGFIRNFATVIKNSRGESRNLLISSVLINISDEDCVLSAYYDITDRLRAEEEVLRREQEFKALAENSPDLISRYDRNFNYLYANPAVWAISRANSENSSQIKEKIDQSNARLRAFTEQVFETGSETLMEFEIPTIDGRKYFHTRLIPELNRKGEIETVLVVSRDITARKEFEEQLSAERERLTVTLLAIGDGVIATDTSGKVLLLNPVGEELTGWTQQEALGLPLAEVFRIVDARSRQPLENPLVKERLPDMERESGENTLLLSRAGTERNIVFKGRLLHDKENNPLGGVIVFSDITEKLKLAEERRKSGNLSSLGMLAGGIAHDFNNVLTGIVGYITLARLKLGEDNAVSVLLAETEKAVIGAKELTRQLLTFARGGTPVKETANVEQLIRDTTQFVLHGTGVECDYRLPEGLWQVEADRGQISQVLQNLVLNSVQAMQGTGKIVISASNVVLEDELLSILTPGKYILISVKDNGTGIKPEDLEHIFDPYFTTKKQGSGLGLAISYSIIKKHGGHIQVSSEPGMGTSMQIYLPASSRTVEITAKATTEPVRTTARILIMDDEEVIRSMVSMILDECGYFVDLARDGKEALDCYRRAKEAGSPYDVVLMDLTIPGGMGGKEAIKKLLEMDPQAKAIVASGYFEDPVLSRYKDYGFKGRMSKPFNLETLEQTISAVLEER